MDQNSDIDAWRRVHRQLTLALMQSQDNIAAELTKRRYLLEEMNRCRVLNAQKSASGGSSGSAKVKKKATPKKAAPKKAAPKKAPAPASKVPKKAPSPSVTSTAAKKAPTPKAAAARSTATDDQANVAAAATSTAMGVGDASSKPGNEVIGGALQPNLNLQLAAGISPQLMSQVYLQPAVAGMYGSNANMGIGATPQSMDLAFQLIQQMNQNATNNGGDDDDSDENDADE